MSSVEGSAGTEWVWMCELDSCVCRFEGDKGAARWRVIHWARGGSSTTQRGGKYGLFTVANGGGLGGPRGAIF